MERKVGSSTVTAKEVKGALKRGTTLTQEEEKVVRMRQGEGVTDVSAPLPRAAGGNTELGDELLLIEMQLLKAARMMKAKGLLGPKPTGATTNRVATNTANPAKEKIVRALRGKRR